MSRDNQRPVFSHTRNSEEAVARMSSTKFVFLKIFANSQDKKTAAWKTNIS